MNMDEKNYWVLIALYKCLKVSHVDCIDSIQDMVNMFGNEFNLYSKCSFLLVTSDVRKSIIDLSNKYHFCYHLSYLTYEKIEEIKYETGELYKNIFNVKNENDANEFGLNEKQLKKRFFEYLKESEIE